MGKLSKNLSFDSSHWLIVNFVTIHANCAKTKSPASPLRHQYRSWTTSPLSASVSIRGEGNSGLCFLSLCYGKDSGCLLSIRAALKANNKQQQTIYFISVCEATSRRDSTRLITLNQHCPHLLYDQPSPHSTSKTRLHSTWVVSGWLQQGAVGHSGYEIQYIA